MEEDMVRAERKFQKQMLLLLLLAALFGLVFLFQGKAYLKGIEELAARDPELALHRVRVASYFWAGLNVGGALLASAFLLRIGLRVLASGRYPAPGMRVLRDTRIVRGAGAKRQGVLFIVLTLLVLLLSTVSVAVMFQLLDGVQRKVDARHASSRPGPESFLSPPQRR